MRNFMKNHGQRGCNSNWHAHQETGRNDHPINKIVHAIPKHNHIGKSFIVLVATDVMAMMPMNEFFQHEKSQHPTQNGKGNPNSRTTFVRLRNQMQKSIAQKGAASKSHRPNQKFLDFFLPKRKSNQTQQGKQADDENT